MCKMLVFCSVFFVDLGGTIIIISVYSTIGRIVVFVCVKFLLKPCWRKMKETCCGNRNSKVV